MDIRNESSALAMDFETCQKALLAMENEICRYRI